MWLVDPWHACLLVESRVPIYFVPQVLVNLVIGLGSYRLIFQTATVLIHARAQDFPSQQNATWGCWYPHAAPNHVTRWPLTRLPACGKLRPNLLCATGACQSCHWLRIMSWCIHVCTTSRITRVLVRACWSDIVCQTMWLVDPWHACLLVESCVAIYFVPQVLVNVSCASNPTD